MALFPTHLLKDLAAIVISTYLLNWGSKGSNIQPESVASS